MLSAFTSPSGAFALMDLAFTLFVNGNLNCHVLNSQGGNEAKCFVDGVAH
jgi:hypothetical protein